MEQERNFGPQPLADVMQKHDLTPAKLVEASTQQLNHKMVSRAVKGRRLTGNVMKKIREAVGTASGVHYAYEALFNYKPRPSRGLPKSAPSPASEPDSGA